MKKFFNAVRRFFFPPDGASRWAKVFPYLVLVVLFLLVVGGSSAWTYTDTSQFCGTTCHAMQPEYATLQISPHAQIDCIECHVDSNFASNPLTRKIGIIRHAMTNAFTSFEYPIEVVNMRPNQGSCECCHKADKFSNNSQRAIVHFGSDDENTMSRIYMILKTGDGTVLDGSDSGIHWHIKNQVLYYATDPAEQEIPYIKVFDPEISTVTEYIDINAGFDPLSIQETDLKAMDCVTCHNRTSHTILQPENAVDQAILDGAISSQIPEIRRKAVDTLGAHYESTEDALKAINALSSEYQGSYPGHSAEVDQAVRILKDLYIQSNFPDQKLDWDTHPNNLGHLNDPGCFRCHDGKHIDLAGFAIPLECNLCHTIPVITNQDDPVPQISIPDEDQPSMHRNPNWIALHRYTSELDVSLYCRHCHDANNTSKSNTASSCANSACHDHSWKNVNFDLIDNGPYFEKFVQKLPHYPNSQKPIESWAEQVSLDDIHRSQAGLVCLDCHEDWPPLGSPSNETCLKCHGGTMSGAQDLTSKYDPNPHDWHYGEGMSCSNCHLNFGPNEPIDSCGFCHTKRSISLIGETAE